MENRRDRQSQICCPNNFKLTATYNFKGASPIEIFQV